MARDEGKSQPLQVIIREHSWNTQHAGNIEQRTAIVERQTSNIKYTSERRTYNIQFTPNIEQQKYNIQASISAYPAANVTPGPGFLPS
jgi:hypothetical protein